MKSIGTKPLKKVKTIKLLLNLFHKIIFLFNKIFFIDI